MKVNLNQTLINLEGKPILVTEKKVIGNMVIEIEVIDETTKKPEEWTLRKAVVNAISNPLDEDKGITTDKAIMRWKLAVRLHCGGEQELTPEEATEIRNRLPKCFGIILSGQACEMLKG